MSKEKCGKCGDTNAHYVETDGLGYWHFSCDEHDERPFFQENRRLKEIVRIQGEALKFYAEGDGRRIVETPSGKHWIQEYGCGCCTQSYQVDPDGTIGMMDCELDNVAGWTAREAIAQVEKLAKPEGQG